MSTLEARITAIKAILAKLKGLDLNTLVADVESAIEHPPLAGAIGALADATDDGAIIAGLIPGGQGVAAALDLASTALGLLGEAVKASHLAPDFGLRLAAIHVHVPPLFAVNHGQTEALFGDEFNSPERVFGFTLDP